MVNSASVLIAWNPGETLQVPYRPNEPISFVMDRITNKLVKQGIDPSTANLFFNGVKALDSKKSVDHYKLFGHMITYLALPDPITIYIVFNTGKMIELRVSPAAFVRDVKDQIASEHTIPSSQQRILLGDKELRDDQRLRDGDVVHHSALQVMLKLRGGGPPPPMSFVDVQSATVIKLDFVRHAPIGRLVIRGTNIELACSCTRHDVIFRFGMGVYELGVSRASCPVCQSTTVKPVTCGFWLCKYRTYGLKADDTQHTSEWKYARDTNKYHYLDPSVRAEWDRLAIESRPLPESDQDDDDLDMCAICLETLQEYTEIPCGHRFHEGCIRAWKLNCPICRASKL